MADEDTTDEDTIDEDITMEGIEGDSLQEMDKTSAEGGDED